MTNSVANIRDEIIRWEAPSLGMTAKIQRICRHQTRQDVANNAGFSLKEVDLFEESLPLAHNVLRRLLRVYDLIVESESEKRVVRWN